MVSKAKQKRAAAATMTAPQPPIEDVITVVSPADMSRQQGVQLEHAERNAVNRAELRANAQKILTMLHGCRPNKTSSTYGPKQKEFQAFCRRKQYYDSDTVT